VARLELGLPFAALTPSLSRKERDPSGAALASPLPLGKGQGEG